MLCLTFGFFGAKSEKITTTVADSLTQEIDLVLQEEGLSSLNDFAALDIHQVNALTNLYKIKHGITTPVNREDIFVPLFFFLSCAIILFIIFFYNWKDKKKRYELLEKSIEKGVEIPQNVLIRTKKERDFFYYLRFGIILIAISCALISMGFIAERVHKFAFAAVPVGFLALAFFVIAFMERAKAKNRKPETENI